MSELKPIFSALCRSKVGAILLLLQIAITTAVVSNSVYIVNDKINYLNQETGYPEQDIFTFQIMSFASDVNESQQAELDEANIRSMPGVIDAAMVNAVPLSGSGSASSFSLVPGSEQGKSANASIFRGDEHLLNTLDVDIIEGRNFTESEVIVTDNYEQLPTVVIVTKAMADELFPDGDALGKSIYRRESPAKIIGITSMMKGPWLKDNRKDRSVITPFVKANKLTRFVVRTEPGQRAQVMSQVEQRLYALNGKRVIYNVKGLDDVKARYVAEDKLTMRMLMVMITVLVLITALGIFGMTLFNISKRTKQIGTRRALGAKKSDIIKYFVVENAFVCSAGITIGGICAIALGQQLMLHYDLAQLPYVYIVATGLCVFLMSILAVIEPARKAANISPSIATRTI